MITSTLLVAIVLYPLPPQKAYATPLKEPSLIVNTEAFQMIDSGNGSDPIALRFGTSTNYIQFTGGLFRFSAGLSVLGTISGSSLTVDRNASISGALLVKGNIATKATLSGAGLTVMGKNSYVLGNVGIGKSGTPNTKLEVVGTVSGSAVVTNRASIGTTASGHLLTVGRVGSGTRVSTMTNATLFSVDQMALGQLEGGAYFGRVGIQENQLGLNNYGRMWSSRASSAYWLGSAMSSDGKVQAIINDYSGPGTGNIYVSNDYGTTWTAQGDSDIAWNNIAMSSDGKIQVATVSLGSIYVSSNYGVTWTSVPGTSYAWSGIAMSSDGQIMAASTSDDYVYISKNYGKSWTASTGVNTLNDIAMSSDGKIMSAIQSSGKVHVSTDYGSTWRSKESTRTWRRIAMSDDGKFQTATVYGGTIYRSTDYGNTWSSVESTRNWEDVEMSSDGALQVAIVNGGYVYVSTDYGSTWAQTGSSGTWNSIAMSSDGKVITAVQNGGYAYVSYADSTLRGNINVSGTISGTTLNANTLLTGSTLQGFGLYNCQGTSNKLTYNSTTKKFLCESDQTGSSSYTAGQGLSLNGSSFSVNATLTGSLAKFSTLSGYVVHAKNALSSSGTLRVVGAGTFDGSLTFGDALADAITVNASTWTFANDTNVVLSGGVNGLSFDTSTLSIDATNDRVGIGTTAPKTTLDVVGTVSGSTVHASSRLASSGSLSADNGIYVSGRIMDQANTSAYFIDLDDSSFSIQAAGTAIMSKFASDGGSVSNPGFNFHNAGGDSDTGMYRAGAGLIGFAIDGSQKAEISSNGIEGFGTISGTTLNANTLLTGSTLQGFGLYNCQGTSNKLTYNSTTKKFLCESDQAGSSSYTAGQGLSLNGSSFSVNATLTGSLAKFSTLSGNVVHAKSQLSSSGNLVIETTANSEFIRLNDSTNASSIGFRTGAGDPNGIVSATLGSLFIASDTGKIWKNNNGSTQWVEITTGSGSTHIAKMVDTNGTTISATPTLIDFDTEEIDVGDIANSSTDRFTVSKAGSYLVTASYQVDQNDNTQMHAMIYKNGTLWKDTSLPNISTIMGIEVTDVLSLQIGDYIQFYGQCESYDCISSTSSTDKYARMSIVQLDGISGSGNSPWTGGSVAYLTDTAGKVAIGASNADTKLEVIGTISGTTLNANTLLTGSTLQGFGLYNCQGTSNKLTYNSTTKKFLCESDQAGSSYTAGQGLSLNGSSFSVNATLTGSLAKFSTLSGYVVHAKNALSSSGTLRVVGAGTFDGSLTFGDALADAITVNASTWTFANDTNFVLSGGVNGLSFDTSTLSIDATNDRVGIGTTAPKTTLEVVGTVSGSVVWGYNLVNSQSATSGSVLVSRQNNVPEWKSPVSSLVWFLDGVAVQAASQGATVTMPYGMSLSSVTLRAKNAPTGSALIVDINENGTTLFSTRPQINAGATTGGSSAVFSDTTLAAGSDITVDIDQIGSTVAGSGVTIMLNGVRRY